MERVSPYVLCKQLEARVQTRISSLDIHSLPPGEKAAVDALRQSIVDARLTIRDYELADSKQEQLQATTEATDFLRQAEKGILAASGQSIFGAVDVAHLSATIEQIIEAMR